MWEDESKGGWGNWIECVLSLSSIRSQKEDPQQSQVEEAVWNDVWMECAESSR